MDAEMRQAAKDLEFEKAAMLRDQILELRMQLNDIDETTPEWEKARRLGESTPEREPLAAGEKRAKSEKPKRTGYRKPTAFGRGARR